MRIIEHEGDQSIHYVPSQMSVPTSRADLTEIVIEL